MEAATCHGAVEHPGGSISDLRAAEQTRRDVESPLHGSLKLKVLFLPSHVGLGHVMRDLAVARTLRKLEPVIDIEWCSAEPASSMIAAWDERLAGGCPELESFSTAVEGFVEGRTRSLGEMVRELGKLKTNFEAMRGLLYGGYDLVFADEFWELVYAAPEEVKEGVVFGTDLVYMPYSRSPFGALLSVVLNVYFKKRLKEFRRLIYLNDPTALRMARWYLVAGGRVVDWLREHAISVGLLTSYIRGELPRREEARRKLKVGDGELLVIVAVGGTSARSKSLLDAVDGAAAEISRIAREKLGTDGIRIIAVPGPRTSWEPRSPLVDVDKCPRSLASYYAAADVLITRAGRTTTADIICSGAGAVLVPVAGHMEQEQIAKDVHRRFGYAMLEEGDLNPRRLAHAVVEEARRKHAPPDGLCSGVERTAEVIASLLKHEPPIS